MRVARRWWLAVSLWGMASLGAQADEVVLHGFRNPVTGLEVRTASVGLVVGFFPDIVDTSPSGDKRTTWFAKTGVFVYPLGLDAGDLGRFEPYLGLSLVQGLGNAWNVSESVVHGSGLTFDGGLRWAAPLGLDLRLGAVLLVGFDGRQSWNPAPGIGWIVPSGEQK